MSLPYTPDAVDTEVITDTILDQLVANYEAIFDGSAFDDGTVRTKYGTVARYVRLHSGLTSQPITLESGSRYLAIILNSDHSARSGRITQGGSLVAGSFTEQASYLFTPGVSSLTCTTSGSGSWSGIDCQLVIIKLDNDYSEWANTASLPYPDLDFADEEVLQATKLNKLIANVNAKKTTMDVLGVEKVNIQNNTATSMVMLGFLNTLEVTTPSSIPSEKIVSELDFDVTSNLEGRMIMVGVSAEYLWESNDYAPERVDIRDSENNIVATKDFEYYNDPSGAVYSIPINMMLQGLDEDTYTVEIVYYLGSSGSHAVDTAYPGITNITVMAFGV